jgi:hypothetical protein
VNLSFFHDLCPDRKKKLEPYLQSLRSSSDKFHHVLLAFGEGEVRFTIFFAFMHL